MQVRSPKVYDVCIIGSGAAGGTAAKVLTEGGLSVACWRRVPPLNPEKDFKEHVWPYELPHRGVGVGGVPGMNSDDEFIAPNGAWEIEGEPYTSAPGSTISLVPFTHCGRPHQSLGTHRSPLRSGRFQVRSTDGMGDDWPITYEEVSPYYDKVESYIGVFGTKENIPSAPDGIFLPPPPAALHRNHYQEGLRQAEHSLRAFADGDPDQAAEWTCRLPLLRAVRPRLHYGFQLQFQPGHDSAGARRPDASR